MSAIVTHKAIALRSPIHDLVNSRNPVAPRANAVQVWLDNFDLPAHSPDSICLRANELVSVGLNVFDSLHLAWAENLRADIFVTTDDKLLSFGRRHAINEGRNQGSSSGSRGTLQVSVAPNQTELRKRGLEALVRELGYADAMRFMLEFETGHGNYTQERTSILGNEPVEALLAEADRILKSKRK